MADGATRAPALSPEGWRAAIETTRLRLVPLTPRDAADLHPVLDDARLHVFTGGRPLGRAALEARFERLATGTSDDGSETWANWVVRARAGETAIGYVQATIGADEAELAWVIGTAWQGRGYASEAAAALAAWLLGAGVPRLTAHIRPDHHASAAVARAAGLRSTGELDGRGEAIWAT
jgi:RimJ/RimL family protein N-acetyltransferase